MTEENTTLEETPEYTPEKVTKLLETWIMVIEVCGEDRKKLSEHRDLFFDIMDMTEALGEETFKKTMEHFYDMSNPTDDPAVFGEREGVYMEKLLVAKGIKKKYSASIMDSYLTSMTHSRGEMVEMIFGEKLAEEILEEQ